MLDVFLTLQCSNVVLCLKLLDIVLNGYVFASLQAQCVLAQVVVEAVSSLSDCNVGWSERYLGLVISKTDFLHHSFLEVL